MNTVDMIKETQNSMNRRGSTYDPTPSTSSWIPDPPEWLKNKNMQNDTRKGGIARTDETRSLCLFNKVGFTKQKRKESIASNYIESAV